MTSTAQAARAALVLDDVLTHPHAVALLTELRRTAPTGLLDQLDAAVADVHAGMLRITATGAGHGQYLTPHNTPAWLRLGALAALTTWCAGRSATCLHSPNPNRPQPVAAAAWHPNLIVCGACTHLLAAPNRRVDATCDGCGHQCAGVDAGDGIWPGLIAFGPLTYSFGTCRTCTFWTTDHPEGTPR